jgi:hypothetical protein
MKKQLDLLLSDPDVSYHELKERMRLHSLPCSHRK